MRETPINRNARGRFEIPGKRKVELDLGENDHARFIVVQKEIAPDLPSSYNGINIEWFNSFGVRHRKADGSQGDYADITYTVIMDALPVGKRLFAYYGSEVHELRFQTEGKQTRASLSVGDPPIGSGP